MNEGSGILRTWRYMQRFPGGAVIFSKIVGWRAPFFSTIKPLFRVICVGRCELAVKKRRGILNHIGSVHAIAMCNMAELACGMLAEVSVPASHRWIPSRMTTQYLRKATSDLRAVASIDEEPNYERDDELCVIARIYDAANVEVANARIYMHLSKRV